MAYAQACARLRDAYPIRRAAARVTVPAARRLGLSRSAVRNGIARRGWRALVRGAALTASGEPTRADWALDPTPPLVPVTSAAEAVAAGAANWQATMSRHNRLVRLGYAVTHYPPSAVSPTWAHEVGSWLRARAHELGVPYRCRIALACCCDQERKVVAHAAATRS